MLTKIQNRVLAGLRKELSAEYDEALRDQIKLVIEDLRDRMFNTMLDNIAIAPHYTSAYDALARSQKDQMWELVGNMVDRYVAKKITRDKVKKALK